MGNNARKQAASKGVSVDLNRIFQIESSGNPRAYNTNSQARGLGQITPIVLKEWNNMNPREQYGPDHLFQPEVNQKIANWYMNQRIPQMLNAFGVPDTVDNRLISYNAGIGYVAKKKPIPQETINYLQKYRGAR